MSAPPSTISVRRGVPNSSRTAASSSLTICLDAGARRQDVEIVGDLGADLVQLVGDLVAAERGQALQAQFEDGARLLLGEIVGAVLVDPVARIVDQLDQRLDVARPASGASINCSRAVCGSGALRISVITSSILATAIARPTSTWARSRALRSRNFVRRLIDLLAEGDEGLQHVDQRQQLRLAAVQRHHVGAERGLQRREAVELVEDDVGIGVALQLDDDAVALAVAFVADVGDALDALVAHQLGHLLDHRRLVHLVGNLGDDDRLRGRRASARC